MPRRQQQLCARIDVQSEYAGDNSAVERSGLSRQWLWTLDTIPRSRTHSSSIYQQQHLAGAGFSYCTG